VLATRPGGRPAPPRNPRHSQRVGTDVGIAVIGTVLFGTLHLAAGPREDLLAAAFSRSAGRVLLASHGFMIVALILVLALPRQIPEHASASGGGRRLAGDRSHRRTPDRLTRVAARHLGDELVDRVLVR
jgi:hypothetical protein